MTSLEREASSQVWPDSAATCRQVVGSSPIAGSSYSIPSTTPTGPTAGLVSNWAGAASVLFESVNPLLVAARSQCAYYWSVRGRSVRVSKLGGDVGNGRAPREQLGREGVSKVVEAKKPAA